MEPFVIDQKNPCLNLCLHLTFVQGLSILQGIHVLYTESTWSVMKKNENSWSLELLGANLSLPLQRAEGLKKACKNNNRAAPHFLHSQFSPLDKRWHLWAQDQPTSVIRVRVQRLTKPRPTGAVRLKGSFISINVYSSNIFSREHL